MAEYGESLSERELEILKMVATGVTNREVAFQLDISVNTVKVHLRNIFTKLGAESRTEATMIAVQEGWVLVEGTDAPREVDDATSPEQAPNPTALPPLSWFKRIALLITLLLAAGGMALTWPSQTQTELDLTLPITGRDSNDVIIPRSQSSPWQEHAQMPTRRAYLALASVDMRIFAIAGQGSQGITGAVEIYDPIQNIWTPGTNKPTPVTYVAAATIGTTIYVPGGCDEAGNPTQIVEAYDAMSDTWHQVSPLPKPLCACAIAALQDKVYLFGGWDGEQYVADTYVYDPQTDTWTTLALMPMIRGFAAAATLENHIYVVGGYNNEKELAACTIYEPASDQWTTCAPMAVERSGIGLVNVNGNICAIGGGGFDQDTWRSYLGFNECYNPVDDNWTSIETPLIEEWRSPGVVAVENIIYAIGGWSDGFLSMNQSYAPLPYRVFIPVSQK
jgi:DNA-binding CsgD family transcriptional regulator